MMICIAQDHLPSIKGCVSVERGRFENAVIAAPDCVIQQRYVQRAAA
jgi:hypothetical protein